MSDDDILDWKFKRIDKSRPPLRWFANLCGELGAYHVNKAFRAQDKNNMAMVNFHGFMFNNFFKVSNRWGTIYKRVLPEEE